MHGSVFCFERSCSELAKESPLLGIRDYSIVSHTALRKEHANDSSTPYTLDPTFLVRYGFVPGCCGRRNRSFLVGHFERKAFSKCLGNCCKHIVFFDFSSADHFFVAGLMDPPRGSASYRSSWAGDVLTAK